MKSVSIDEAIWSLSLLPRLLPTQEPLGPINLQSAAKLESAIMQPFVSFGGYYPYRYVYHRAAALFYFVIKDHSMENGNKRSAVVITMLFLFKNKKMLDFSHQALYEVACEIAETRAADKDPTLIILNNVFKKHIVDLTPEML